MKWEKSEEQGGEGRTSQVTLTTRQRFGARNKHKIYKVKKYIYMYTHVFFFKIFLNLKHY